MNSLILLLCHHLKEKCPRHPTLSAVHAFPAVRVSVPLRPEWKQKHTVLTDCIIFRISVSKAPSLPLGAMSLMRTDRMRSCAQSKGLALAGRMVRTPSAAEGRLRCGHRRRQVGPCHGRNLSFFSYCFKDIAPKILYFALLHQFCLSSKWFLFAWKHAGISPLLNTKNSFVTQLLTPVITPFFCFPL